MSSSLRNFLITPFTPDHSNDPDPGHRGVLRFARTPWRPDPLTVWGPR